MSLSSLIAAICSSFTLNQAACYSSLDASFHQMGLTSSIQSIEDYGNNKAQWYFKSYVTPVTGEEVWAVGGGVYKVYRDKHIGYGFRVKSLVDSIQLDASPTVGSISVGWKF